MRRKIVNVRSLFGMCGEFGGFTLTPGDLSEDYTTAQLFERRTGYAKHVAYELWADGLEVAPSGDVFHGLPQFVDDRWLGEIPCNFRGRSQLSTFMKAYTAYARGEGVWDHCTLFPLKINIKF